MREVRKKSRARGKRSREPLTACAAPVALVIVHRALLAVANARPHSAFLPADLATPFPLLHGLDSPLLKQGVIHLQLPIEYICSENGQWPSART